MKIYLATPVNGRSEKTLREKQLAAMERIDYMTEIVRGLYPDAEFINPVRKILTYHKGLMDRESTIMGTCVQMVMDSDLVIFDDGWMESKGCRMEHFAAFTYRKKIMAFESILLSSELSSL